MTTELATTDYVPRSHLTPTEEKILDCTVRTIAELGYPRTTIGELGKRLALSKGVIHYHFPSKEDLVQDTIARIYATARNYMSPQIWTQSDPWEQVQSFIDVSCTFYQRYAIQTKALQEIRANFRPHKHKSLAQTLYERELADLAAIFTVGQEAGVFRAFDPAIAALTLRFALNGAAACLYTQPSYDIQRHARELVELFKCAWCR